jgi:hypothetical protein
MPKHLAKNNIGKNYSSGLLLKSIDELEQNGVLEEMVIRVKDARIAYINYDLLKHDFPQLQSLENRFPDLKKLKPLAQKRAIEAIIEDWLIQNTAFISENQAGQTRVNTEIITQNEKVKAYRPPGYGRALVFSVEENDKCLEVNNENSEKTTENRLLDVKGIGVAANKKPSSATHSNGLNRLGFALFELLMQELLQRIFIHSKSQIETLPIYGIIDLGFDEKSKKYGKSPASLLVRRAHRRPQNSGGLFPYGSTEQHVQLEIELLLRKYGITSVNDVTMLKISKQDGQLKIRYGEQLIDFFSQEQLNEIEKVSHFKDGMETLCFDGINIQHTHQIGLNPVRATLVDFQSYNIQAQFTNPLLCLVSDRLLRWGGSIWPDYADFVVPDPKIQIPYNLTSETGPIWGYNLGKNKMKIDSLCYGLADDFRAKRITKEMLLDTLQIYLNALTAHWNEF